MHGLLGMEMHANMHKVFHACFMYSLYTPCMVFAKSVHETYISMCRSCTFLFQAQNMHILSMHYPYMMCAWYVIFAAFDDSSVMMKVFAYLQCVHVCVFIAVLSVRVL